MGLIGKLVNVITDAYSQLLAKGCILIIKKILKIKLKKLGQQST
jgi:hypothetical protein